MMDPLTPAQVLLDRQLGPAATLMLRTHLQLEGAGQAGDVVVAPLSVLEAGSSPRATSVALYDGLLEPRHAALLSRRPALLLLACREASGAPSAWEVQILAQALREGPLLAGVLAQSRRIAVGSLAEIALASEAAEAFALEVGAPAPTAKLAAEVMHELTANALLDAPADSSGAPKYAHQRSGDTVIAAHDACEAGLLCLGGQLLLSATDRFGRLSAAPIARAVEGLGRRAKLTTAGGGAGLGFRRLLAHCDLLAIKVLPGRRSEIVASLHPGTSRSRAAQPKSVFLLTGDHE